MAGATKADSLRKARSLLAGISRKKVNGEVFRHSEQAAETLTSTIQLLERLQSDFVKETIALDPSSTDWKVLKALLELLVRLGISPHLDSGVGIPRDKQQEDERVISFQLSALSVSSSLLQSSSEAPLKGIHLLFTCAELLSSFFWSSPNRSPSQSFPPSTFFRNEEALATTTNSKQSASKISKEIFTGDFGTAEFSTQRKPLSGVNASSPFESSRLLTDANSPDDVQLLPFLCTRELVMKFFSWDLIAAYLQLGYGPSEINEGISYWARDRLNFMFEHLPVEKIVVALFVLLSGDSTTPPPWLKSELGKHLSKLVMRRGGLITILEELVGRTTKGSVESYDKVARHLAKVPKSVATADSYLEALCPQLLPLLLLKHKLSDSVLGEISLTALNNIFHTSVSLACKLFLLEPKLATKYVVKPIMRPLLALSSMQKSMDTTAWLPSERAQGGLNDSVVTENEVVDSLVKLSVLLTAGSHGSSVAREVILVEAKVVAPMLLELHFQLDPENSPNPVTTLGTTRSMSSNQKYFNLERDGLRKGNLKKGVGSSGSHEEAHEGPSNISKLCLALSDVVMAVVNQSVEPSLPFVLPFLLKHTLDVVRWPEEEGKVWEALQSRKSQSTSKIKYLSRLLMIVENWPLVVALMGKLLHLTLNAPWSLLDSGGAEYDNAAELLRYMQDFEELNREAGLKALEQDTSGAVSLVKVLLDDELVLCNKDLLELVLHMVYSVLNGIRALREDDMRGMAAYGSILTDLLSSLERLRENPSIDEKSRRMSSTLAENVSALCNDCEQLR